MDQEHALQKTHAFSPIHVSSTRTREPARVSFSYFMRFLQDLFRWFFFNSNSSPLRKVSKRTNEISYSLHEERERQRKGRKEKETKGKEKRETRKMHTSSPAQPNLFSALPRLLVAPQKRTLAAVYDKMDRTIPGFSGAVILPTSMKYKKVTHIYKAIHRILRTLLLTQSIA